MQWEIAAERIETKLQCQQKYHLWQVAKDWPSQSPIEPETGLKTTTEMFAQAVLAVLVDCQTCHGCEL